MAPQRRLVVGLGNPLAGSDAFGPAVAERLRERGLLPAGVSVLDAGTDLVGHLDDLLAYDHVILVDVVIGAGQEGDVVTVEEDVFSGWPESAASWHHLSPLVAVKLFRTLHPEAATRVTLIGYCTDEITLGPGLPDAAVEEGAAATVRLLAEA